MDALADSNWLIRLEAELAGRVNGPAKRLLRTHKVFYNPVVRAEFLSSDRNQQRRQLLDPLLKVSSGIDYRDADLAARLRLARRKQGKGLTTPDALIAASAMRRKLRLLTADKDFSGIPGLSWSAYRA